MKVAAEAGDSETFSGYIDFPSVRTSLKDELMASMAADMARSGEEGGFAALGSMLGVAMVDRMVDAFVTPAGLRAAFMRNKESAPAGVNKVDATSDRLRVERKGLSEFVLHDPAEPAGAGLVFVRHGLSWRLSGMHIPLESGAQAAPK